MERIISATRQTPPEGQKKSVINASTQGDSKTHRYEKLNQKDNIQQNNKGKQKNITQHPIKIKHSSIQSESNNFVEVISPQYRISISTKSTKRRLIGNVNFPTRK